MPVASAPIRVGGLEMRDPRKEGSVQPAMQASGHAWREARRWYQPLGGELGLGVGRGTFGRCGGGCRVGESGSCAARKTWRWCCRAIFRIDP
jgi:hypothetical protein